MLNLRDAGIKKKLEPLCMAIINSNEKILFIILAMISVSKMKNSVYNLIGLEDSCICDHYLTEFFLLAEVTKDSFSMRLAQIHRKVTRLLYLAWLVLQINEHDQVSKLNYCGNMKFNFS